MYQINNNKKADIVILILDKTDIKGKKKCCLSCLQFLSFHFLSNPLQSRFCPYHYLDKVTNDLHNFQSNANSSSYLTYQYLIKLICLFLKHVNH